MCDSSNAIVNYVWVNEIPFFPDVTDPESLLCGVPLHYVDKSIENAERYPDAEFKLWFDFDFLDDYSRLFIDSVVYFSGCQNIKVHNLRDIDIYKNEPIFDVDALYNHPSGYFEPKPYCKYALADLARVIVLKHMTDLNPIAYVFYCDFDVDDVAIENCDVITRLNKFGMAVGNTEDDPVENGYMAFIKDKCSSVHGITPIDNVLNATAEDARVNRNGYRSLKRLVNALAKYDEIAVAGLLRERGYQIPKPPYLEDYKIC